MTDADFDDWLADVGRKFPAISVWFRQLGQGADGLLSDWRDALAPVELRDLLAVNSRMLAGDDEGPGKFATDWQVLPSHVRRLAQAARLRREISEPLDRDHPPDLDGPRYRCAECRDSGKRFVAHPAMISAWFAGNAAGSRYRTAVVLCACPRSDPIRTRQGQDNRREGVTTFRESMHFPLPWSWLPNWERPEMPVEMLEKFTAWCESSYAAWKDSKRHKEFDRFNQQEAYE